MEPAYARTPRGEIHYWHTGEGTPLVMLHWAPASGRMYARVAPLLANRGLRVFALDLPGYGRSHKSAQGWSIPQIAQNLLEAADALGLERFHLLGGHLSASVAVEIATANASRVRRLVLDGLLNLDAQEMAHLLRRFGGLSPMIDPAGAFKSFPMEMVLRTLSEWNPDFELCDETLPEVYSLLNDYLEMGFGAMRAFVEPSSARPVPTYPLAERLAGLRCPTLMLSAEREPLSPALERSVALVAGSGCHVFPGVHPLVSRSTAAYAAVVGDFFNG